MDEKLLTVIGLIAGSSYLALGGFFIIFGLLMGWVQLTDPVAYKGIPWLIIYVVSLLYLTNIVGKPIKEKLKIWFVSTVVHSLLIIFVIAGDMPGRSH